MTQYWLLKSEPDEYSYEALERDGKTLWTGVRNFEARKHLRAMKPGDLALYYHTGDEKAVVGVAKISSEAVADPTAPEEDWASVEVQPKSRLKAPVTLTTLKGKAAFKDLKLVTHARLSVMPVSKAHFDAILKLGKS